MTSPLLTSTPNSELGQPLDGLNSLGPSASVQNVVDGVVEGRSKPLDLIEVELMDGTKQMSLLGVTIGVVADGDIGSEWLRCMGFLRAYLHVAWRFIFPAPYLAKVSYLPLEIDKVLHRVQYLIRVLDLGP